MKTLSGSLEASARSIKKAIHAQPHELHIRFPRNLGDVCAAEVQQVLNSSLSTPKFSPLLTLEETAVVVTNISSRQAFELPLRLKTAHEILWILRKSRAGSMGDLKDELSKIDWPLFTPPRTNVAVKLAATASKIFHETAATKAASGVLQKFGLKVTNREQAEQLLEIKLHHNQLQVAISMDNGQLHRRGYKQMLKAIASLREDLAAGATQLTMHWLKAAAKDKYAPPDLIYVPFAGSGTLGFEAALNWFELAPANWRQHYACEQWPCAPEASLSRFRKKLQQQSATTAWRMVFIEQAKAQSQALQANVESFLTKINENDRPLHEVITGDLFAQALPDARHLFIPLNPPYGMRLKNRSPELYKKIGSWLTQLGQEATGVISGYIFIPDEPAKRALQKAIKGFILSGQTVTSGGKTLTLALFRT